MPEQITDLIQAAILPILVGTAVWWFQSRLTAINRQKEQLHTERRTLYSEILKPYIQLFSGGSGNPGNIGKAIKLLTSPSYKTTTFQLMMLGSDEVVKALNDMMQYFYNLSDAPEARNQPLEPLEHWGELLLAIRRDLGNKKTKLEPVDMLRTFITDIDQAIAKGN